VNARSRARRTPRTVTVVVGGQFGSEAKGKVCDFLAPETDLAVRTGSPNAGHTVVADDGTEWKLQQLPATFANPDCRLVLGAGTLIDPQILAREVELLGCAGRLTVDPIAGIIEPRHAAAERDLMRTIGSTGKGVGAATRDRIDRSNNGSARFKFARDVFDGVYRLASAAELSAEAIGRGERVLVEGTQGFGLSLLHGHYPYVTSRDTTAAAFLAEAGISPLAVSEIVLVIRTYPIRVAGNSGPLQNEISWQELSARIGRPVVEHTTVTKKRRRVAEFDLALVERAVSVNQPTQIALQFLNYLFPADEGKRRFDELSRAARAHVLELERQLGVPVTLIGTGPRRSEMIDRR
jgi:adenylosuccinate synthase